MADYFAEADAWWEPARERARADALELFAREQISVDSYVARWEVIGAPDWVPDRDPRRMPRLRDIVLYWAQQDVFDISLGMPMCFACHQPVPTGDWNARYLQRAHLVNRARDGLDGAQNLVPLCVRCHRLMPMFGDGPSAIAWVLQGGWPVLLAEHLQRA